MVLAYEILQIPEVVQILNGNFSSLNKNRQQMRRFLIQNVFNDNCRPSDEGFIFYQLFQSRWKCHDICID